MRSSSRLAHRVERMIDRLNLGYGRERGIGTFGIEACLEQLDEPAGDPGMAAQRVFHVGLAEGGSRLPQKFRVEPQYRHLPSR